MTDFDARLHARLERLDAAVPVEPWTDAVAGRASRGVASGSQRRRRRFVILLAAAALIAVASAATAGRIIYPDLPDPALEQAIASIWAGQDCVPPSRARSEVQVKLDELQYADWSITAAPGAETASCAAGGVIVPLHEVRLYPGISADIERASEIIADGLLANCLGRADAIQYVTSVLTTAGSDPFVVRADPWGPQGGPTDKIDEYRAHVAAGCFVYVGMPTRDSQGRAVHDLWGPWFSWPW